MHTDTPLIQWETRSDPSGSTVTDTNIDGTTIYFATFPDGSGSAGILAAENTSVHATTTSAPAAARHVAHRLASRVATAHVAAACRRARGVSSAGTEPRNSCCGTRNQSALHTHKESAVSAFKAYVAEMAGTYGIAEDLSSKICTLVKGDITEGRSIAEIHADAGIEFGHIVPADLDLFAFVQTAGFYLANLDD